MRTAGLAVLVMVLACGAVSVASAAPMQGQTVTIRQPDGTTVDVRVWGDEYYAHGETVDGYSVTRDLGTGYLSFATLSADGDELLSTGIPAGEQPPVGLEKHVRIAKDAAANVARRSREDFIRRQLATFETAPRADRSGTTTGDVVGITLIIDFSDDTATIAAANFDDYCNKEGYSGYGNNGSVRDYFYDVSEGNLTYTNFVPTQYFRAPNTKSYYCNPSVGYGQRAQELVAAALNNLDASGFDFSQYDSNGDGIIDAVNCFYAGNTWNNWAEGLWPHAGWLSWSADGVSTERYQISNAGSQLALGTFCHENGHMLMGWPDLYDYDGDSQGVGSFCLMCAGCFGTNPNEPCAYFKMDAGWADVTELWDPATGLPVSVDGNVMYRFQRVGHPNEFYLVENRQSTGRDAGLPDNGLAIWHVDTDGSNNYQQQTPDLHYLVTLVQADGDWDLENNRNSGDNSDLYAAPSYTDCTPTSYPTTAWWDRTDSQASFFDISASGSMMTFDFMLVAYALEVDAPALSAEIDLASLVIYPMTLENRGTVTDNVTISIAQDELPAGVAPSDWPARYSIDGGDWKAFSSTITMSAGEVLPIEVRLTDTIGTTTGMALTTLTAQSLNDAAAVERTSFGTFVGLPSVLLVDDDGGASYESYIETALADTGYAVRTWDTSVLGRPSPELLASHWAVLWTTADGDATGITAADEQSLMDYLDAGGNVLLSSMDYLSSRGAADEFTTDYLHIDTWTPDSGCFVVGGAAGDPISDGMSLGLLAGPFPPSLSDVIVTSSPAVPIFSSSGLERGLRVEENGHKAVFLSFPFECVKVDNAFPSNQRALIDRVMTWFDESTGVADGDVLGRLAISQNHPNPFNPVTNIAFTVPAGAENATLRIYDVSGRLVATLVDEPMPAGAHSVVWDGTNRDGERLASGVYFARLNAGMDTAVRKMTLLK